MAPRPTLLVYNTEEMPAFRSTVVKPGVFDAIRPFLPCTASKRVRMDENSDPELTTISSITGWRRTASQPPLRNSDHQEDPAISSNTGLRRAGGRAAARQPDDRWLARKLAGRSSAMRYRLILRARRRKGELRTIVPTGGARLDRAWTTAVTKHLGVETTGTCYNGGRPGFERVCSSDRHATNAPATILLTMTEAGLRCRLRHRLNIGEQVLAVDLRSPAMPGIGTTWMFEHTGCSSRSVCNGDRPLGIEVRI